MIKGKIKVVFFFLIRQKEKTLNCSNVVTRGHAFGRTCYYNKHFLKKYYNKPLFILKGYESKFIQITFSIFSFFLSTKQKNFQSSHFSILPTKHKWVENKIFSILPLFHPPNQTNPSSWKDLLYFWFYQPSWIWEKPENSFATHSWLLRVSFISSPWFHNSEWFIRSTFMILSPLLVSKMMTLLPEIIAGCCSGAEGRGGRCPPWTFNFFFTDKW